LGASMVKKCSDVIVNTRSAAANKRSNPKEHITEHVECYG